MTRQHTTRMAIGVLDFPVDWLAWDVMPTDPGQAGRFWA